MASASIVKELREISGAQTQHITKVLNIMRSHYKTLYQQWQSSGHINSSGSLRTF